MAEWAPVEEVIEVSTAILDANDRQAAVNESVFLEYGVTSIHLMSSPGSGKTTLLAETARELAVPLGVIVGDLETENDAQRLLQAGMDAQQVCTQSLCHLEARHVADSWARLPRRDYAFLFIENVGNLVCPAGFALGQHRNVVLLSCTEGDDKPSKYPWIFRLADLVVVSKCDLLPLFDDFQLGRVRQQLAELNPQAQLIEVAASEGEIEPWLGWLEACRAEVKATRDRGRSQ